MALQLVLNALARSVFRYGLSFILAQAFFVSLPLSAEPFSMTIENVQVYVEGTISRKKTEEMRVDFVGTKLFLEFFSQGDIIRVSHNEYDPRACERIEKSFFEDKYNCANLEGFRETLVLEKVGNYVRKGTWRMAWDDFPMSGEERTDVIEITR